MAGLFILLCYIIIIASTAEASSYFQQSNDSSIANKDTITPPTYQKYIPSSRPSFELKDRRGNPFSNTLSTSPLLFLTPTSLEIKYDIDTAFNYTISEQIGSIYYRPITLVTFSEYNKYQTETILKSYWKERSAESEGETIISGKRLIPKIYLSPSLDRVFGGSYIEINPRGNISLDFGGKFQRIENESLPLRQQKSGDFNFNEQISMNVVGKIGEKLKISTNFDNNSSFDFQEKLKIEFTGFEEDIIKKIELGNVSMPISNSLISSAQTLFGVKTELQFGKLFITGVASTQRGKQSQITVDAGGVQSRDFNIKSSDYEEKRHFFLGHFFRNHYEEWLLNIPRITSDVQINRVEVYVININNNTKDQRNIAAFMDLGEGKVIYQKGKGVIGNTGKGDVPNNNTANNLFSHLVNINRQVDHVNQILESPPFDMTQSTHYNKLQARKLAPREFYINKQLGYISLNSRLNNSQMLAVSYEYTYKGVRYQVGELSEDYATLPENEVIFLKMLKPDKVAIADNLGKRIPTWDLMMKNIYSLGSSQISQEGFQLRVAYRDDKTGQENPSISDGENLANIPLIEILKLDRLNQNNDTPKDGNFDFLDGITINIDGGKIIFPVLEPFGSHLENIFKPHEFELKQRYVYDTLYRTTKSEAQQDISKDKFSLQGSFKSGSTNEISLEGIKISEGSVVVTAGGISLVEGSDFTVDYSFGKVQIINESIINSGKSIQVSYENADAFNSFQSRTLVGSRFDYRLSDNINFGATVLRHFERPLYSRPSIGEEPVKNTKYGFDINYRKESTLVTKLIDFIPLIQTKESSLITASGEFAQLLPSTSNIVNGEGTSYIDDFENSSSPYFLNNWTRWKHASVPQGTDNNFDITAGSQNNIKLAYKRARIAWYTIDNTFYGNSARIKPKNISTEDMTNHFVRPILNEELFPLRDKEVINTNISTFDIAYFPSEKGIYNLNPDVTRNGLLKDPEGNWGGITIPITTEVDFDKMNIEYLEFWLMDPFLKSNTASNVVLDGIFNQENTTGGELYFNLGSVSEDIMRDGKMAFENGLPENGDKSSALISENNWGYVTNTQYINNAFNNTSTSRLNQDIGLDGMNNEEELVKFKNEIDQLPIGILAPTILNKIKADPSNDDFEYFLSDRHNNENNKIIERYKRINGIDKNSPNLSGNTLPYSPSGSKTPDNEDLNKDHAITNLEEYYEYKVKLNPNQLKIGENHIVDKTTYNDGNTGDEVNWYLFRIPIDKSNNIVGNITDFKSIRYIRMYLTGWQQPVVLRTANLRFVGNQWRKFTGNLESKRYDEVPENQNLNLGISVVNIEENSQGGESRIPYVLPPGTMRDRDNTSIIERNLNEQSIQLCVEDLPDKNAQAAFKNIDISLVNYGRIKMFLHAQSISAKDDDLTAFLRLGSGFDNYYEIELPLKITQYGTTNPNEIWASENEIDISLNELYQLKSSRNASKLPIELPFSKTLNNQYNLTIVGNPKLSVVTTIMIGVRNPESNDQEQFSACIWANELRVTDFNKQTGWAGKVDINAKLADFATISAATSYTGFGFGNVQTKISERAQETNFAYDISGKVNLDKFLPSKLGIKIPVFASFENRTITPYYDPLDSDISLENSIEGKGSKLEKEAYRKAVINETKRKSLNITNIRKEKTNPKKPSRIHNIENFSASFAYSNKTQSNSTIQLFEQRKYVGSINYIFNPKPLVYEPFKTSKKLKSNWLKLIKDINFNFSPSSLTFSADLNRVYLKTQYRNKDLSIDGVDPNFEKTFNFNRHYGLKWNFTKALSFDYSALVQSLVDELEGEITESNKEVIITNLKDFGRIKNFDQKVSTNFKLPLDKLPISDWINADIRYSVNYKWISASLSQIDTLGSKIDNAKTISTTSKFDLVKLYNKLPLLKTINAPKKRRSSREIAQNIDTIRKTEYKAIATVLKALMMLRSVNISYNIKEGTTLAGFKKIPYLFGMDSNWDAPGWDFILGSQTPSIRMRAADNGWLVKNTLLNDPFTQSQIINLSIRAKLEPFKGFRIQLDFNKEKSANYQEIFRIDSLGNSYESLAPSRSGSYTITFLPIKTSFKNDNTASESQAFQKFIENRNIIKNRLNQISNNTLYTLNNQDVLTTAFLAAYSGKNASSVALTTFPKVPMPNWRVDYAGLGKIASLRERFSSIIISHAYISTYSIARYTNSLYYNNTNDLVLTNDIEDQKPASKLNDKGSLVPIFVSDQLLIVERFAPLIKVSFRTRNKLNLSAEYKTGRILSLNLTNTQVNEIQNKDLIVSVGFIKANMKVPFKIQGRTVRLKNDLDFRMDISLKESIAIQRKYNDGVTSESEAINTITDGSFNFQLRPNIGYLINDRFTLHFYYERNINTPKVSNSVRRSTTAFGIQIRLNLAQ